MKINPANGDFEKFLESHNITPTPRRIQVLKLLLTIPNKEFTASEMKELVKDLDPSASKSSIVTTLQLFRSRGLIREVTSTKISKTQRKKGRPEAKYIYHQSAKATDER